MKRFLVNLVFKRYRTEVEDRFVADMFSEVPTELTENSMKFLLSGGTQFDRWMRMSSYALQRKLEQPNREVGRVAMAGLIFFKTLNVMIGRLSLGQKILPVEESVAEAANDVAKDLAGVDEFFKKKVG